MSKDVRQLSFATWLRVASMLLILLCHYCAVCDVPTVAMLSQIFNIGVQLFFILSGFLVGYKGISRPHTKWYLKRIKRIFVPYWLFLAVLVGVYAAKGLDIFTTDWLLLVLGCQGSVVGVWGAEQTWFISVLLLCYLLSPVILLSINKVIVKSNRKVAILACSIVCVLPCVYALFEAAWVYTILTPVSLYIIACVLGVRYSADKHARKTDTRIGRLVVLVVAAFALRFVANVYIDGTIWYDRIIVPYTHMIAACSIFEFFEIFFREREVPKVVKLLSDISLEVYLYHYMFTVGPISVYDRVTFWPAACLVVTVLVLGISLLCNKVSTLISNSLSHKAITRKN